MSDTRISVAPLFRIRASRIHSQPFRQGNAEDNQENEMKKIVTPHISVAMFAVMAALMLPTLAKAQRVVRYADTTQTAVDEESFQRWNIGLRAGAGYDQIGMKDRSSSGLSSSVKAGFTYKVSVGAEYRVTNRFSAIAGLEMNQRRHRLETNAYGLTGSSDFVDKVNYTTQYLAFPVSAAYDFFVDGDMPIYLGVAINIPIKGTRKRDVTMTGIQTSGNDNNSKNDIPYDVLNVVPELRLGFWSRSMILAWNSTMA